MKLGARRWGPQRENGTSAVPCGTLRNRADQPTAGLQRPAKACPTPFFSMGCLELAQRELLQHACSQLHFPCTASSRPARQVVACRCPVPPSHAPASQPVPADQPGSGQQGFHSPTGADDSVDSLAFGGAEGVGSSLARIIPSL